MEELVNRIKEVRKNNKLTQKEFADAIGYSQGNVCDWERGRSAPSAIAIQRIVSEFNVDANWLLTGKGYSKADENNSSRFILESKIYEELDEDQKKDIIKYANYLIWIRNLYG